MPREAETRNPVRFRVGANVRVDDACIVTHSLRARVCQSKCHHILRHNCRKHACEEESFSRVFNSKLNANSESKHLPLAEIEDSDRVGEFRLQFLASRTARFVN